jgi:hypothetical protein
MKWGNTLTFRPPFPIVLPQLFSYHRLAISSLPSQSLSTQQNLHSRQCPSFVRFLRAEKCDDMPRGKSGSNIELWSASDADIKVRKLKVNKLLDK